MVRQLQFNDVACATDPDAENCQQKMPLVVLTQFDFGFTLSFSSEFDLTDCNTAISSFNCLCTKCQTHKMSKLSIAAVAGKIGRAHV